MTFLAMPGPTQLWIIALIVLLLFGARKLPDLARAMGSSISQFKRGLKDSEDGGDLDDGVDSKGDPSPRRVDGVAERPGAPARPVHPGATREDRG